MDEIDFKGVSQPRLAPNLQDKIADTFRRKLGREVTREEVLAWWDWIWPDFESYWGQKRYRNIGRAIQGWAARIRPHELDQAVKVKETYVNQQLDKSQQALNEQSDNITSIDYFSQRGESK